MCGERSRMRWFFLAACFYSVLSAAPSTEQWLDEEGISEDEFLKDCLAGEKYCYDWEQTKVKYENATQKYGRQRRQSGSSSDVSNNTIKSQKQQARSTCSSACNSRRFRLPKIELRKFDGNLKNWIGFWGQYRKIDSDDTLDDDDKFQYLYQCTVPDSPARELIDSFPPSGANYTKAIEQLKSRFARDDLLIEVYVRELLQLVLTQAKGNTSHNLGHLYDKLNTQLQALESLNVTVDKFAALLFPLVESALPESVLRAWERSQCDGEKLENRLSQLMQFLKREVETEERIQLARSGLTPGDNFAESHTRPTAACLVSTEDSSVSSAPENDGTPSLLIRTRTNVYNIGEKKAIYCYGKNLPQRIEWYSPKNEQIGGRTNMVTRIYVERPKTDTLESCFTPLIIQSLKITDSGNWTCRAGPDLSDTIEIFVGEKVKLSAEEEIVADQDKTAKLVCETKGTPEPVVQWYKDNSLIKGDDVNIFKTKKGDVHTLEIRNLNHMDRGTYLCRATQEKLSHYADKTFHLRVRHQPIITNVYQEKEVYAILNEIKNITCSAIAYPPPKFSWAKRNEDKFDQIINDEETVYMAEDGSYSVLMLRVFNESALGQYKCSVQNSRGRQHIVFDVSLGNKPEPPTSVEAVQITAHNITFNVTCASCVFGQEEGIAPQPDNLPVLGYNFQLVPCQEGYSPYWVNATEYAFDINNETDTLFTVENLNNATEYHVRVATRNAAGLSDWFAVLPNPKTADGAAALTISTTLLVLAYLTTWY